jgi:hypothetical protein
MRDQERAVVDAAKAWANHPSDSRAKALVEAVRKLEANTCPAQGILGDPAWPYSVSCERTEGHEAEYHKDPVRGIEWRSRR